MVFIYEVRVLSDSKSSIYCFRLCSSLQLARDAAYPLIYKKDWQAKKQSPRLANECGHVRIYRHEVDSSEKPIRMLMFELAPIEAYIFSLLESYEHPVKESYIINDLLKQQKETSMSSEFIEQVVGKDVSSIVVEYLTIKLDATQIRDHLNQLTETGALDSRQCSHTMNEYKTFK